MTCRRVAAAATFAAALVAATAGGSSVALAGGPTPIADPSPVPSASKPADRATFGLQPASAGKPDSRPLFSYGISPGGTFPDAVAMLNYSVKPIVLSLSSADLDNTSTGGLQVSLAKQKSVDVGSWLDLSKVGNVSVPGRSSLGPGQVVVPFKVAVPGNATPGDHAGAIVATLSTIATNKTGQQVKLDQRVASRVFVRVSGVVMPELTVTPLATWYDGTLNPFGRGVGHISYRVANTGNVRLALSQVVAMTGLFGTSSETEPPPVPLLLPGSSIELTAEADLFPTVFQQATVTLTPSAADAGTVIAGSMTQATQSFLAIPWTLIGLVLLLMLLCWLLVRRRLSRGEAPQSRGTHRFNDLVRQDA